MPEQRIRLLFVCQVEEEAAERLCRVPVKNDVMKRIIFSVFILYAYVGFSSCGGLLLKTPFKKSMEETTESVSVNEQNQVNAFLQELYDKYVFWSDRVGNFEDVVEHFSPRFLLNCVRHMNMNMMVAATQFGFFVLVRRMVQKINLR